MPSIAHKSTQLLAASSVPKNHLQDLGASLLGVLWKRFLSSLALFFVNGNPWIPICLGQIEAFCFFEQQNTLIVRRMSKAATIARDNCTFVGTCPTYDEIQR